MLKHQTLIALFGSLMFSSVIAAEVPKTQDAPPPPMPEQGQEGDVLEPEVTIVPRKAGGSVEEYRLNGRLYAVKIKPAMGPSYFLVDGDGDGYLESRRSELDTPLMIPGWVLLRW